MKERLFPLASTIATDLSLNSQVTFLLVTPEGFTVATRLELSPSVSSALFLSRDTPVTATKPDSFLHERTERNIITKNIVLERDLLSIAIFYAGNFPNPNGTKKRRGSYTLAHPECGPWRAYQKDKQCSQPTSGMI